MNAFKRTVTTIDRTEIQRRLGLAKAYNASLSGTSLPIGGPSTHAVLTAHRGLPTARLFTDLDKMRRGDRFYIEHLGGKLAYQVDSIKVITPDRVDELYLVPDKDYVTLLTCTPYMINSHRLLVRGKRIPYKESLKQKDQQIGQRHQLATYGFIALGLTLVLGLLWYRKRQKKQNRRQDETKG
ncbi:sortase [Streptococcus dysgalactiae subsp. equisimilis]|nr:sortase [Streptococcus dysgalactiae subsp. equisimilis]